MSRSNEAAAAARKKTKTKTKAFGTGKRESHDSSAFYDRKLVRVAVVADDRVVTLPAAQLIAFRSSSPDA